MKVQSLGSVPPNPKTDGRVKLLLVSKGYAEPQLLWLRSNHGIQGFGCAGGRGVFSLHTFAAASVEIGLER